MKPRHILAWLVYQIGVAQHKTGWPKVQPANITHYRSKRRH